MLYVGREYVKKYVSTEFHFIHNSGGAAGSALAEMPDEEFRTYLAGCRYEEQKQKYKISSDYVMRKIGGDYAIVPVGTAAVITNAVMTPNYSAVFIWNEFMEPSTVEDVVVRSALEFEGETEKIREDVHRFARESLGLKILEEVKE